MYLESTKSYQILIMAWDKRGLRLASQTPKTGKAAAIHRDKLQDHPVSPTSNKARIRGC